VIPAGQEGNRMDAPPRILFVNQYYWPDHASTAQHLTDLAEHLAGEGFEVHVLASRGSYKPGEAPLAKLQTHNGVTIHRVGATALGRRSTLSRMTDYLTFYAQALRAALMLRRFDVVVTLTTPPLIGLVGTILRRLRGTRHVIWSMDLHPDASLALGQLSRRNPAVRGLAALADAVCRRADAVVSLGHYMADRLAQKGVRPGRIRNIPVWSRRDEIDPLPRDGHPLRRELGLEDRFVCMYSGNMGLAHRFEEFLEAARQLRHRADIVFLYVGGGPRLKEVLAARDAGGLENVRVLDYFPRSQLRHSLSVADVHLISLRAEMVGIVLPSKLFGAMAAARPVLFVGPDHCETAETLRESGCGIAVRSGDVHGLVEAIEQLAAGPESAREMGRRGREAFLAEYEREACCAAWSDLLAGVLGATVAGPGVTIAPVAPAATPPIGPSASRPALPRLTPSPGRRPSRVSSLTGARG
jgi:glycosyltransferase involved in cell wall biosynthesis